ncbi:hypothetical protein FDP41_004152 [Naegleria fowleri]|uniref:peptidylprolyl isomerase n=1 Tax=Naegleria fowleri TaxID=5763 RepID=A0A6A5BIR6_NAEFO|nr:uncharacterized protein FDP41_004152 [Naegleria fowleri]KAF0976857.1 hypothetical protein FDP41_004152 [Naegleria fowleri]CAG4709398.1 unnamed protein product [Naegleria fowleri]
MLIKVLQSSTRSQTPIIKPLMKNFLSQHSSLGNCAVMNKLISGSSTFSSFHTTLKTGVSDRETEWERQHRERMKKQEQLWKESPEKLIRYFVELKFLKNWNRSKVLVLLVLLFVGYYAYDKVSGRHGLAAGIYQLLNGPKKGTGAVIEDDPQTNQQPTDDETVATSPKQQLLDRIDPSRMRTFAYLDVEHADSRFQNVIKGRIIIGLYDKVVPVTSYNFEKLCESKELKGTIFHRVINKFMIQGGDTKQGTGMSSVPYIGRATDTSVPEELKNKINDMIIRDSLGNVIQFKDENFDLKHSEPYLVCMANRGPNTNGSQFFITTESTPHLDNKHVVFGKVLQGMEIVDQLQKVRTSARDKPIDSIKIVDCGVLSIDELL